MSVNRRPQYMAYGGEIPPNANFPEGNYLQVDTTISPSTCNEQCWTLWDVMNREVQTFSALPPALTPELSKDLIENALKSIDRVFSQVFVRVVTRANRVFSDTFGGPPRFMFEPYPIRWAGESREALRIILKFVSAIHQLPQVQSNRLDNGILDHHAWIVLRPLFDLKASIMKSHFGIEVRGEISPDELDAIFRNSNLRPPLLTSLDDRRDPAATLTEEDQAAMANESAHVPTQETLEEAQAGIGIWTWQPTQANWATFAELLRRVEYDGPSYVPGEPFPFSTDIIGGGPGGPPLPGSGATPGAPGLTTPS